MRLRISLLAPFTSAKVLLAIPSDINTISQLKRHLFRSLASVAAVTTASKDIRLEVDGFELLAGSGLDVLEEGDVVRCVSYFSPEASSHLLDFLPHESVHPRNS
jgi:hypothetical protein